MQVHWPLQGLKQPTSSCISMLMPMTIGMTGIRNAGSLASARSVDRPGLFRDDLQRSMTPGIASYYNNIAQNGAFSQV